MTKFLHNKFLVVYAIVLLVVLVLTGQLFSSTSFFIFIYLTALFFNLKLAVKAKSSLMTSPRVKTLFSLNVVFNVIAALISILALYSELILLPHAYLLSVSILLLSACYWQVHQSLCVLINKQQNDNQLLAEQLTKQQLTFESTLQESQNELENKVQERTLELHIALQELEDVNRELAKKTTLDDLTGLFNRRYYDQKILAEYRRSRRNLSALSILVVDIDHFKKVNDTYGHLAGDQCLVAVAQQLKQALHRSSDVACRYGGEEFCLILPETEPAGAMAFAEELRLKISQLSVEYQGSVIPLTISCGVSCYQQQEGASPELLFSAADQALYQAKQQGRNQVQLANPTLLLKSIEE